MKSHDNVANRLDLAQASACAFRTGRIPAFKLPCIVRGTSGRLRQVHERFVIY